jgi:hypothetical protein
MKISFYLYSFLKFLYYILLLAHSIFIASANPNFAAVQRSRQLSSPPPVSNLEEMDSAKREEKKYCLSAAPYMELWTKFQRLGDSLFVIFFRANRPGLVIRVLSQKRD